MNSTLAYRRIQRFNRHSRHSRRREMTGQRNLDFSQWLRDHCRPALRGCELGGEEIGALFITDVDVVLYDYQRRMLQIIEVKLKGRTLTGGQTEVLELLNQMLQNGAEHAQINYRGFHTLILSGTTPTNSASITWDGAAISKETCWRNINMLDAITPKETPP